MDRNGAAVHLRDVGEVVDSVEDLRNLGLINNKRAVLVILYRQPGANIVDTVDHVLEVLPLLKASMPASMKVTILADRTVTIRASVEKTSRVMIVHEDTLSFGYGAEISARIASELFSSLDAPIGRVAALDTWVGYHPQLETEILPQVENLAAEAERLLQF